MFTSLLLRLDEHSLHTLAVVTSSIERILADIVAITLKAIYGIQIDNLRPVDAYEVLFRSSIFIKSHDMSGKFCNFAAS